MRGLNAILANRSQLQVLRTLYEHERALTGRETERRTGLSNRATMLALDALVEARAVNCEKEGRAHYYTLNHEHYLVERALRPAFDAEIFFWDDLRKAVRATVRPKPLAAVATGPLAREEADYGGRLILTMIFSTGRNRIRALATIGDLADTIRDRYGMVLEHNMLDTYTMDREEYTPLWRRVEREGILLFGTLP
jgi:DNA-binding transcriptional ArsR family regulator|tara:strand:- start:1176 stop:1760 length:585 start_codon:yes stop_codon:yes gene_type:complete